MKKPPPYFLLGKRFFALLGDRQSRWDGFKKQVLKKPGNPYEY